MIVCPNCGKEIEDKSSFCYYCGEGIPYKLRRPSEEDDKGDITTGKEKTSDDTHITDADTKKGSPKKKEEKEEDEAKTKVGKIAKFIAGAFLIIGIFRVSKIGWSWPSAIKLFTIAGIICLCADFIDTIAFQFTKEYEKKSAYEKSLRSEVNRRTLVCYIIEIPLDIFLMSVFADEVNSIGSALFYFATILIVSMPLTLIPNLLERKSERRLEEYLDGVEREKKLLENIKAATSSKSSKKTRQNSKKKTSQLEIHKGQADTSGVGFGSNICMYREKNGMSQAELGKKIGKSTAYVAEVEADEAGLDVQTMILIAQTLNVSLDALTQKSV